MSNHLQTAGLERRREDYGPITGRSRYVDDLKPLAERPPALHMLVVRSPYAHARIKSIQLDAARSQPGVLAAFQGAELVSGMSTLDTIPLPGLRKPERRPLAVGRARYVGDPVAVILAENLYAAEDARDLVDVEYELLPAVVDPEAALEPGAPLLYDEFDSNIAFVQQTGGGDIQAAFEKADRVTRLRIVNQRLAPSSLELRACMFDFDPSSGELSAWVSSQAVFRARDTLARFLGLDCSRIKVHNAEVGGAFGAKTNFLGEELVAASLAVKYGRPIKWIEQRSENLQAQSQGRGEVNYIEAAFQDDGRLLGLRVHSLADLGAFLAFATAMVPGRVPSMLCGPYQLQALESKMVGVFTNKATTAPYRGAGRPEAAYILERTMDRIAHELALDPAEVRRRNFIPPQSFPYTTVTGLHYDSGNYQAALDRALELADYTGWRSKQREYRQAANSRLLGIGLSTFIEFSGDNALPPAGMPREAATVRIRRDGTALVQSGVSHNGQGHFTTFAQIAATTLNLPASKVEVRMNDTGLPGYSIGTYGSRVTQVAGSAVLLAAEAVREKAIQLAARVLEAAPADLTMEGGKLTVRGVSARAIDLGELARMVEEQPDLIERESPNPANGTPIEGLAAWRYFSPPGATYSSGTHLAVVEIDPDTGEVQVLKYVAVDDCGRVLNHYLVEAQIHGGLAQGIGQALYQAAQEDPPVPGCDERAVPRYWRLEHEYCLTVYCICARLPAMKQQRAYKYRFYPTGEQVQILAKMFGCCRYVYNWALRERTDAYYQRGERLSYEATAQRLTQLKKQEAYAWLGEVSSVPLQQSLRHLDRAFRSFFEGRTDYPTFKKKRNDQSVTYAASAFKWDGEHLTLARMEEHLPIVWSRPLPDGCKPSTVTVTKDMANRYFVSLLIEEEIKLLPITSKMVGLDLGLKSMVITSDGQSYGNPKFAARDEKKLARAQRKLSKKKKGSKNRAKARKKVAKIHAKIADRRHNYHHQLSTQLIRENQVVCVESLHVKNMVQNHSLAKAISDVGWSEFVSQVEYKARWYGRTLVKIDQWYPSSKRCCDCGHTLDSLSLDVRQWICPACGSSHDRDINAAKNVLAAGLAVSACGEAVRPGRVKARPGKTL